MVMFIMDINVQGHLCGGQPISPIHHLFSVHCIVVPVGLKLLSVSAPFVYPATDFFSFKGELTLLLLAPLIKYYNVCICKLFCRVVSGNATIM